MTQTGLLATVIGMSKTIYVNARDLEFDWAPVGAEIDLSPRGGLRPSCSVAERRGIRHERCSNPARALRRQHPGHPSPEAGTRPVCGIHAGTRVQGFVGRNLIAER